MSDMLKMGVIGAGATGGYLAGRLAAGGIPVTLLARGRSLETIRSEGIRIEEPDGRSLRAYPAQVVAAGHVVDPVDVALFCVKSYDTEDASAVTGPLIGESGRVLCTQNGIENETVLVRRFGTERVMSGVFYIGAERVGPNIIRCTAPPRLVFGPVHESNQGLVRSLNASRINT